ncbi:MAG: ribonuclease III [Alphaproteobacteria bacterium]|nr:ribonuclease III [Alphaproteobacteria bacterium]
MLGVKFADQSLLIRALTHASVENTPDTKTYERLEFLGDRVLGLVVCDFLMRTYQSEDEGALSRRLSGLVDRATLASVASSIELDDYIIHGGGTSLNDSIQADVMESLFGAIYRDGGLEKVRPVIEKLICALADEVTSPPTDSKTALQEWAQGRKLGLPQYREVGREGPDHQPVFSVEVSVDGGETCIAQGSSKRAAEQAAAAMMLEAVEAESDG